MNNRDVSNVSRIQGTNDNSILSKCSMIKYGYFKDDFLPHMIGKFSRRAPLINRGYYIRAKAIEYTLLNFIEHYKNKNIQIVSLGAGFDTSFFRLSKQGKLENCTFIEMDYFDVAQRKATLMKQEPNLWNCLKNPENVPFQKDNYIMIDASNYKLIGIDLTKLDILDACIRASRVSYDLPTLFLSECVITYISIKKSTNLLKFIAKSFSENCFVLYEQIYPDDNFGKFMCMHFKQLGSSLRGIATFKNKADQIKRFLNAGWDNATGSDMSEFYYNIVPSVEKSRIENLEVFDEYEEWLLKCNHYLVLVACKGMDWQPRLLTNDDKEMSYCDDSHIMNMVVESYQVDESETYKYGGIKTHYVKANLIYTTTNDECIIRASGYGQNPFSAGHCRLSCVSILNLVTNIMTHIEPTQSELLMNTLCGSMTQISVNKFIFFGGRSSPLKPNNIVTSLQLCHDSSNDKWQAHCNELTIGDSINKPSPRWRHIAGVYWIHNQPMLLIYGGRNSNPHPLSDTYVMDLSHETWRHLSIIGPGPLCSASVVSIGRDDNSCDNTSLDKCCGCCCILVFGGLSSDDLVPCGDLWRYCGRNCSWTRIQSNYIVPRFSHTSHIVYRSHNKCNAANIKLVSLGGVSHKAPSCNMSVISVDLTNNTAHCTDLILDSNNQSECVMIHNHGSAFSERNKKLWVLGGGGNCFSFGTQLNENIYSIDLAKEEFYK